MEYQHMSALDASQDREGHEIDSGGRSESDDESDQDSVAIGNLAAAARAKLADQLLASGRPDAAVEAAFRGVPRHTFLPEMDPVEAYQDRAVVIKSDSEGLPVSASTQPTVMAVMLSQLGLAAGHRVLEIGTGTGYNAALIARIVGDQKSVVTIDVVPDLTNQARVNLTAAGYGRVTVVCGDGAAGVPDHAPYDRIIVTTGTWDLATQWWAQLGPAGRIVLPLSIRGIQLSVGLETARLTAPPLGRTRERQTRGTGWPQFLWVVLRGQGPARALRVEPAAVPARLAQQRPALHTPNEHGPATEATTMRAAFADDPVQTQAAEAQSQAECDAPRQALAPAAIPETLARLTRRLQRITGLLRRRARPRATYYDPVFGRPDLIEDDYYRLRNQPRDFPGDHPQSRAAGITW
jgi:methyltransferase of FxLD system